jgi:hypothetical protein
MHVAFTVTILLLACLGAVSGCGRAFAGTPETLKSVGAVPMYKNDIMETVVRYGSFIMYLDNYDDHFLYDIRPLGGDRLGVIMLCPGGREKNLVFRPSGTGRVTNVYEHVSVPQKTLLRAIENKVILISDAKKFLRESIREDKESETGLGHA